MYSFIYTYIHRPPHLINVLGKWNTWVQMMIGMADYSLSPKISLRMARIVEVQAILRPWCF